MFCECKKLERRVSDLESQLKEMIDMLYKQEIWPKKHGFLNYSGIRSNLDMVLDYFGLELTTSPEKRELRKKGGIQ